MCYKISDRRCSSIILHPHHPVVDGNDRSTERYSHLKTPDFCCCCFFFWLAYLTWNLYCQVRQCGCLMYLVLETVPSGLLESDRMRKFDKTLPRLYPIYTYLYVIYWCDLYWWLPLGLLPTTLHSRGAYEDERRHDPYTVGGCSSVKSYINI